MSTPQDVNTQLFVAIAELRTEVSNLKDAVAKISAPVVVPTQTVGNLPISGGIAGLIAAAWTLYLQATGKS